jgi:acyl dehydratase
MTEVVLRAGTIYPRVRSVIETQASADYARATNDLNDAYLSGAVAPPAFGVVATWRSLRQCVESILPPEDLDRVVHGEQDMYFHQALRPGMELDTVTEIYGVRPARTGTRIVLKATSVDGSGRLALVQYVTMFARSLAGQASAGEEPPAHDGEVDHSTESTIVFDVDLDQTFRYSVASGDVTAIHTDDDAARRVGLPRVIVHGICTMAMCSSAILNRFADRDPRRLRRLAVRFSDVVFPGDHLSVRVGQHVPRSDGSSPDEAVLAFDASTAGRMVITHGLVAVSGRPF